MSANIMPAYSWLLLLGVALSLWFWTRLVRGDRRLLMVYVAALAGAFLGAKLAYLLAEGWLDWTLPEHWKRLATGKSILGGLVGGYVAVEWAKKVFHYEGVTGDWFAVVAPAGIVLGRIGCWSQGCCAGRAWASAWFTVKDSAGVDRWPAPAVEILFNVAMLAAFWTMQRIKPNPQLDHRNSTYMLQGQHFHLYLIAYGLFRFGHEFLREETRVFGPFTGYHFLAFVVFAWGLVCFQRRRRQSLAPVLQLNPAGQR